MGLKRCTFLGLCLLAPPAFLSAGDSENSAQEDNRPSQTRTDLHGDPLPQGAVARLGTLRWRRHESTLIYSPDGRYLAATGKQPCLFDAASGKVVRRFDISASSALFFPDSKTLLTTTMGKREVLLWDLTSANEPRPLEFAASCFCLSDDGKLLAGASFDKSADNSITLWDMETHKELRSWRVPDYRYVREVTLSPDVKIVALRTNGFIYFYDTANGQELRALPTPLGDLGRIPGAKVFAFSRDSRTAIYAEIGDVSLCEITSGKLIRQMSPTKDVAVCVAAAPNGRLIAAGGAKGTVYVWDGDSGKLLQEFTSGVELPIGVLAFSPDSKTLAFRSYSSQAIRLLDAVSGQEQTTAKAHTMAIDSVAFSPDGKHLVSMTAADRVMLWDTATGKWLRRFETGSYIGRNAVSERSLAILADQSTLVVSPFGDSFSTWDLKGGTRIHETSAAGRSRDLAPDAGPWFFPACTQDGKSVVSVTRDDLRWSGNGGSITQRQHKSLIVLRDVRTGHKLHAFKAAAQPFQDFAQSSDGKVLAAIASMTEDGSQPLLFVWEQAKGRERRRIALENTRWSPSLALSADGRSAITWLSRHVLGGGNCFFLWEVATGKLRTKVNWRQGAEHFTRIAVQGDRLAAMSVHDTIYLIDPVTGKELRRFDGHEGDIRCLEFSADGKLLASGSSDGTVLIWNTDILTRRTPVARLPQGELAGLWAELLRDDAPLAFQAILGLCASGDQAVAYFEERLRPVPNTHQAMIARLVSDLNSELYAERAKATRELLRLGEEARPALEKAADAKSSLELMRRVEAMLAKLDAEVKNAAIPTGEALREVRAIEVLEKIGSPDAERILADLAKGAPHAVLTREAESSLLRLRQVSRATR
ncbi:MAG: WD40 repeat domain-containing protein [Planctomycetes bacterium]|nr:WD40 repeat domain-containing protein [Planctomycetota bacterium]